MLMEAGGFAPEVSPDHMIWTAPLLAPLLTPPSPRPHVHVLLIFPASCACVSSPLTCRCFRRRFGSGDGSHRGNPHRGLLPAAGGRRRHLLLPEQVRAPHVHRCEPVWEGRTRRQG